MSRQEKLILKLLNHKSTISYKELQYLLGQLGYIEKKKGKTSGSRVAFINLRTHHLIRIHRPHPSNELKHYVKKYIVQELLKQKLI